MQGGCFERIAQFSFERAIHHRIYFQFFSACLIPLSMPRPLIPLLLVVLASVFVSCSDQKDPVKEDRLFELRVYHTFPGKLEALHDRFRNHTLALFEKHGLEHIGYWVTDEEEAKLVYIVAFENKAAQTLAWANFIADPEWKEAYAKSIEGGRLVEKIDSTLLRATDYSPEIVQTESDPNRLFELRTYKASEGNLANLDARFRDTTMGLFAKHGATNLVYFHAAEGETGDEETLIYILAHDSLKAREATFAGFRKDENWLSARAASEEAAGGPLTQGRSVSQFLLPTDYSKIK